VAKQNLLEAGVSVVVNVKRKNMAMLSRLTGASILEGIEFLGTAESNQTKNQGKSKSEKTQTDNTQCVACEGGAFEISPLSTRSLPLISLTGGKGGVCTVLLRGDGRADAVKSGLEYLVYARSVHNMHPFPGDCVSRACGRGGVSALRLFVADCLSRAQAEYDCRGGVSVRRRGLPSS
jgi:hypothetical protein